MVKISGRKELEVEYIKIQQQTVITVIEYFTTM